jgi:hypothetical protein
VASTRTDLNNSILAAHAEEDYLGLIGLYSQAAGLAESQDAECFFLTYAYVFALELGHDNQGALQTRLTAYDRE